MNEILGTIKTGAPLFQLYSPPNLLPIWMRFVHALAKHPAKRNPWVQVWHGVFPTRTKSHSKSVEILV